MNYLGIKNWKKHQHYKDRNPPWIKVHRTLLDDYEFARLQDASKLHLMLIWLFASQSDGRIPDDPSFLQKKLGLNTKPDLKSLIDHGFLIPEQAASNALALDASNLRLEAEAYKPTEKEGEREAKAGRGSRLPADWQPLAEDVSFCQQSRPDLDPLSTASRFRDYWIAQPGSKGVKLDWPATWRNWVRNEKAVSMQGGKQAGLEARNAAVAERWLAGSGNG